MNHVYKINGLDTSRIITLPIIPHDQFFQLLFKNRYWFISK